MGVFREDQGQGGKKEHCTAQKLVRLLPLEASDNPEGKLTAEILQWMIRSWFSDDVYCWYLVAAVYTNDPHSCQSRQVYLQVVTDPGDQQGWTVIDDN